ncbi:hypothetical protein ScPMuIL_001165 [Solemya velum]
MTPPGSLAPFFNSTSNVLSVRLPLQVTDNLVTTPLGHKYRVEVMVFEDYQLKMALFWRKVNDMSSATLWRQQTEAEKNVHRLRNCMPEKFATLCRMHLSFLLDLDGSKLEDMFGETDKQEPNRKMGKCSTPFSKKKDRVTLFGSALSQENVAQIYQLIEYLGRTENIRAEGLFRKTGNLGRQRLLKEILNQGEDLGLEDGTFSPHDCATVLKNYLGELPDPVLTEKHFQAHLQVVGMMAAAQTDKDKIRAEEKQLKTLQLLLLLLPRENSLLLECLLDLLHKVTKVSENMMTAHSLGTVFAPHLFVPRKMCAEDLHALSSTATKAAAFLIENAPELFKIPRELCLDVANFWREMENPHIMPEAPRLDWENINNGVNLQKKCENIHPVNTVMAFADRKPSADYESSDETQQALAQLYAHVQSMPESAKKKKLLKQFQRSNGMSSSKNKHHRSRTFGEQLKKHFPSLHKHKRRGSNDSEHCVEGLSWGITPTIDIEDKENMATTIQVVDKSHRTLKPRSPAVHIVDLHCSPSTPRYRKRWNSDDSETDSEIPHKRPTPERHPSTENEIAYIAKNHHFRKVCPCTPTNRGRPVAMVSPITKSMTKASKSLQKSILTPGSRTPMILSQSPSLASMRESAI